MTDHQNSVTNPAGMDQELQRQMEEPRTAKETAEVLWLMQLEKFCSEASVVGLRYVADQSASVFRRSIWILLLLVGAGFTAYQITSRTVYYFSYPTNVDIHVEHVPETRFPTVTICNENKFTLSRAMSIGNLHVYCLCVCKLEKLSRIW